MLMDAEFQSRDIPWSNCIAFGSDNASVMTGNKKGVIAFIERKQPSCTCQDVLCIAYILPQRRLLGAFHLWMAF